MENLTGQKIVIISDLHLGRHFNQAEFDLIKKVMESGDKLIINGDLWEGFDFNFDEFLTTGWRQLFPLFKAKNVVYLFGNHDPNQNNSGVCAEFSVLAGTKYEFTQKGTKFLVTHGDLFDPTLDLRHPNLPRFMLSLGSKIERLLIRLIGRSYLNVYKQSNAKMKKWRQGAIDRDTWLICGHSHLPELSETEKFANSGIFLAPGLASYLRIDNGAIQLLQV